MKALVQNNRIVDLAETPFEVHSDMQWIDVASDVQVGWEIVDGSPVAPVEVELPYDMLRQGEYPSIGDQLDALFHAGVFPAEMAAQIQAVKDKYPKGGSV